MFYRTIDMRRVRNSDPSLYRLISTRTYGAKLFMVPSKKVQKLIGGIIARYQEMFGVEIYAYFFLSNHYHLLIRAPRKNTDEFCENLNREIALRMNRKLSIEGKFWGRRYDDLPVGESEEDLLRAFLYVTTNATRHGLLENSNDWPGLHSFHHALQERDREFTFYHYSASEAEEQTTRHKLRLSVLPQLAHLTKVEREKTIEGLLQERLGDYVKTRKEEGKWFLGLNAIINLEIGSVPYKVSRSQRPVCYTGCLETLLKKRKEARARNAAYIAASFDYRLGILNVIFPEFSFKPPLHRLPRFVPFQPLSPADFVV